MWLRELSSTVAPLLGALLLSASTSPVPSLDDFALRPLFPFTTRACGDGLKDCDGYCIVGFEGGEKTMPLETKTDSDTVPSFRAWLVSLCHFFYP